jgi:hypothetical protein
MTARIHFFFLFAIYSVVASTGAPSIKILDDVQGSPRLSVERFNVLVSDYFFNMFGANGRKYLESLFPRNAKHQCSYSESPFIRSEARAIVTGFDGQTSGWLSWIDFKKSTHNIRYRVHRLVGILDYMNKKNCKLPNGIHGYHESFAHSVDRNAMNDGILKWLKHVRKVPSVPINVDGTKWNKIVVLCLELTGMLAWHPEIDKEQYGRVFPLLDHATEQAVYWCVGSPSGNCEIIAAMLDRAKKHLENTSEISAITERFRSYFITPNLAHATHRLRNLKLEELLSKMDCHIWKSQHRNLHPATFVTNFKAAAEKVTDSIRQNVVDRGTAACSSDCVKGKKTWFEKLMRLADGIESQEYCSYYLDALSKGTKTLEWFFT